MEQSWRQLTDDLGPDKMVLIHDTRFGFDAFVVIDNVACGPAIGGLRMAEHVDLMETFRLARTMTLKSAAVGLPHGGAKAGIVSTPKMPPAKKEELVRAFARAMRSLVDYIPGPDMGTNEESMAQLRDEIGRAVGLPRVLGGIPLDEIGATGYGLAVCASIAQSYVGFELSGARVAIQGFGSVGRHAALQLAKRGAIVVAAADSGGAVINGEGLDLDALCSHKLAGHSVHGFSGGKALDNAALVSVPCDIWIPAAQPDVIDASNVDELKARLVLCGANLPITAEAEKKLHSRGVVVVPDFIANAGGLICAAVEYRGGTQAQALSAIEQLIGDNTEQVLRESRDSRRPPRDIAVDMAAARVKRAMTYQRGPRAEASSPSSNVLDL